jgi:hypothetical protein
MTRRFGYYAGSAAAVLAALCMVFTTASAQQGKDSKQSSKDDVIHALPPGGPAPRLADGHPDFSGVWFPNSAGMAINSTVIWNASGHGTLGAEVNQQRAGGDSPADAAARRQFDPKVTPEEKPSFQPWAAAKLKGMSDAESQLASTHIQCLPRGVPAIFTSNSYPIQVISTPGQFVQLVELLNNFRVIHTDGRKHNPDPDPLFNGDGVGHWEGDTLVVDTISLDERNEGVNQRWIHSDQEHVVERISRPSMNYLVYQVTVEDPKVLTKPWTSAPHRWSLSQGNYDIQEYYCTHNEEVSELSKVKENESAGNLKK